MEKLTKIYLFFQFTKILSTKILSKILHVCYSQVISLSPDHAIWQRHRQNHHGGALRSYMKLAISRYGRTSPAYCQQCNHAQQHDTLSLPPPPVYSLPWEPVPKVAIDLLDEIDQRYNQCTSSVKESGMRYRHIITTRVSACVMTICL